MQVWSLERIPLPNFSTYVVYTTVSLLGSVLRVCYQVTKNADSSAFINSTTPNSSTNALNSCLEDSWCFWSVINFGYCLLICVARELQNMFFGQLRSAEDSHIRENFSSFIFYKVVFIYGILHVEALHELLLWATWFSILGFLRLLTGLIRDRSQYILRCSDSSFTYQGRIFLLCCLLLLLSNFLMVVSIIVGAKHSLHTMFFMLAEVFQLMIVTVHVITWYVVYVYCELASRPSNGDKLYHRFVILYYTELLYDSVADFGDLLHNLHMLFWNKLQINMSSIIIALHLQHLYYKMSKRIVHHRRYRTVLRVLDSRIIHLESKENCSICWEEMNKSCQLPCGHIFHTACLYLWIEQNTNCPICRKCFDDLGDPQVNTLSTNTMSAAPFTSSSTTASSDNAESFNIGSSFCPFSPSTGQGDVQSEDIRITTKLREKSTRISKPSDFRDQIVSDSLLSTNAFVSSDEPYFSAMVSMDRLLDVHDQLIAEDVANVRSRPKNALPAKFLAALEAELLRHFRLPDNLNNSQLKSFRCQQLNRSLIVQRDHIPSDNYHVQKIDSSVSDQSPLISSTDNNLSSTIYSSQSSSSDSSHTDDEDNEFPPKRVLRLAIRRLLERVSQSVLVSRKACQCQLVRLHSDVSNLCKSIEAISTANDITSQNSSLSPSSSSSYSPNLPLPVQGFERKRSSISKLNEVVYPQHMSSAEWHQCSSNSDFDSHCPSDGEPPVEDNCCKRNSCTESCYFDSVNRFHHRSGQRKESLVPRGEHSRRSARRCYLKRTKQI
ncbi:unnamed protein product [Trichobilharzia szidati]|nr:unnamed protein product [Trichobilharzia szidati]